MRKLLYYSIFFLIMFAIFSTERLFIDDNFPMNDVLILAVVSTLCTTFANYANTRARQKRREKQKGGDSTMILE